MKRTLSTMAALAFIAFFITIIGIADRGEGHQWWAFIERIPYGDKVGHLGLIGMLAFLCNLAIPPRQGSRRLTRHITLTTLVLLVLLSLEEIAQGFIPTRTCDIFDWLADLAGLALGQFAATLVRGRLFR